MDFIHYRRVKISRRFSV